MSAELQIPPLVRVEDSPTYVSERRRGPFLSLWKVIAFVWKYVVGALLCQSLLGSILIVGWTYRLMQRTALKRWWKRSEHKRKGTRLADHLARHHLQHEHLSWPNWFVQQNVLQAVRRKDGTGLRTYVFQLFKVPVHSLWLNLKTGLQGIFNTWVLTLPGCLLWLFAWYDGWNNSFNKGYEQAPVGPLTGILGIVLFIAAMLYVPLAQARQAVTGEWRSFYQFPLIWRLVRRRWLACLALAGCYSLLSIPVIVMKTAPMFFGQKDASFADLTFAQALKMLNGYFFSTAFAVFAAYVVLRLMAARIYARAILNGVQSGAIPVTALGEKERAELQRLNLIQVDPPRSRHLIIHVAGKTSSLVLRAGAIAATALIWFTFVAQIFIAEFFMYHPVIGWLNQPLVQLPWFRYVPAHMQNLGSELFVTMFILLGTFVCYWAARQLTALARRQPVGLN